jgi:hypothetical protein
MAEGTKEHGSGIDGYLFRLIATFEAAAMQQLGKIAHPVTGDVEVSLEGARDSIEMLAMVQRKTEGNLNEDEGRLLQHVLYQLRMNYVDVARGEEEAGSAGAESDEGSGDAAAEPPPDSGDASAEQESEGTTGGPGVEERPAADAGGAAAGPPGDSGTGVPPEPPGDSAEAESDEDQ